MPYAIIVAISLISWILAPHIPNLDALTLALLVGILARNLTPLPDIQKQTSWVEKNALGIGIVLIGSTFQISNILAVGPSLLLGLILMIAIVFLVGWTFKRFLHFDSQICLATSTGMAICGSAAILALSQVTKLDRKVVGLGIGTVNAIGVVGLFILPLVATSLNLSNLQSAWLFGGSLPAVGHVAASASFLDQNVADWAMLIKLARIFMLVPLVLIIAMLNHKSNSGLSFKVLPWFLYGFVLLFSLNQIPNLQAALAYLKPFIKPVLCLAMTAIGLNISFQDIRAVGINGFIIAGTISIIQVAFLLVSSWML